MKTTYLVAIELLLVSTLAGCATLPMDQACRTGIEKETKVLNANGHLLKHHRTPEFPQLISAAKANELDGEYLSCLSNLQQAHVRCTASSSGSAGAGISTGGYYSQGTNNIPTGYSTGYN